VPSTSTEAVMPISIHGSATPPKERQRQQPHGAAAELRRPEADRNHRQQMIETGERMREARRKAEMRKMRMVAGMSKSRGADQRGENGKRGGAGNAAHHVPHVMFLMGEQRTR
jgi:hypothetical protein